MPVPSAMEADAGSSDPSQTASQGLAWFYISHGFFRDVRIPQKDGYLNIESSSIPKPQVVSLNILWRQGIPTAAHPSWGSILGQVGA